MDFPRNSLVSLQPRLTDRPHSPSDLGAKTMEDELFRDFLGESVEQLTRIEGQLRRIDHDRLPVVETEPVRQLARAVKDACQFLNLKRLDMVADAAEILAEWLGGGQASEATAASLMLETVERMKSILADLAISQGNDGGFLTADGTLANGEGRGAVDLGMLDSPFEAVRIPPPLSDGCDTEARVAIGLDRRNPTRILVFESEARYRVMLGRILERAGYEVEFASSCGDAPDRSQRASKFDGALGDFGGLRAPASRADPWKGISDADRPLLVALSDHGSESSQSIARGAGFAAVAGKFDRQGILDALRRSGLEPGKRSAAA
jgi:CheY-like chemotaxis protein